MGGTSGVTLGTAVLYIGDSACPWGLGAAPAPFANGYWVTPTVLLHEVFHLLGAVDPNAPNADGVHVVLDHSGNSGGNDLMYAGTSGLDGTVLDHDRDDYYGHDNPNLIDTEDSPYLTREPW